MNLEELRKILFCFASRLSLWIVKKRMGSLQVFLMVMVNLVKSVHRSVRNMYVLNRTDIVD